MLCRAMIWGEQHFSTKNNHYLKRLNAIWKHSFPLKLHISTAPPTNLFHKADHVAIFHSILLLPSLICCTIFLSSFISLWHYHFFPLASNMTLLTLCNVLPRTILCLSHSITLESCFYYLDEPCLTATSGRLQYFLNYLEIIQK